MLKFAAVVLLSVSFLAGCATPPVQDDSAQKHQEAYQGRIKSLDHWLDTGRFTELEHAKRMLELAQEYYPQDYRLAALRSYKVHIAAQLENRQITRQEYDNLWDQKRFAYMAERQDRWNAEARDQAALDAQIRAQAARDGLNSFNRSMDRNFPKTVNCTSMPIGSTVQTTCR